MAGYRPADIGVPQYFLPMLDDRCVPAARDNTCGHHRWPRHTICKHPPPPPDRCARRDRNCKYRAAITLAIEQFREEHGRAPTVLDVGVGTGMLSAICLEAGCEHVTCVDTNETMCWIANKTLAPLGRRGRGGGRAAGARFEVLHCLNGKEPPELKNRMFDMMVSEPVWKIRLRNHASQASIFTFPTPRERPGH